MHIINKNQAPLFNELIEKHVQKYPTKFKESCFSLKTFSLKATKCFRSCCNLITFLAFVVDEVYFATRGPKPASPGLVTKIPWQNKATNV